MKRFYGRCSCRRMRCTPYVVDQFWLGYVDDEKKIWMFDAELDHTELKKGQELDHTELMSCFHFCLFDLAMKRLVCLIVCLLSQGITERSAQKSTLLQRFVEREALMDLQKSRLEEERDMFKKSQDEAEAYKAVMRQRVEAAEQAERRVKGHLRDYKEKPSSNDNLEPLHLSNIY